MIESSQFRPKGRNSGRLWNYDESIANIFKAEQKLNLLGFQNHRATEDTMNEPRKRNNDPLEDGFEISYRIDPIIDQRG